MQILTTMYVCILIADVPPEVLTPVVMAELAEGVTLNVNIGASPRLMQLFGI
jgi:hypothetical protein